MVSPFFCFVSVTLLWVHLCNQLLTLDGKIRIVIIDAGKQEAQILDSTIHNGERAQRLLVEQMTKLMGRDFFGKSSIQLTWYAGQITVIDIDVNQKLT